MIDNYVTGAQIKMLRENKKMTQEELAQKINVTAKAVSKWETGNGFPDISLLESLAAALGISVIELLSGSCIRNQNKNIGRGNSKLFTEQAGDFFNDSLFLFARAIAEISTMAKKCFLDEKCEGNQTTLQQLYDLNYLNKQVNPISKKYYNSSSIIKYENKKIILELN